MKEEPIHGRRVDLTGWTVQTNGETQGTVSAGWVDVGPRPARWRRFGEQLEATTSPPWYLVALLFLHLATSAEVAIATASVLTGAWAVWGLVTAWDRSR